MKPSGILAIAAVIVVGSLIYGVYDTMMVMRQLSQYACENDAAGVYDEECQRLGFR